jgi:hypothetical protein
MDMIRYLLVSPNGDINAWTTSRETAELAKTPSEHIVPVVV